MITLSKPKDNLGGLLKLWAVPPVSIVSLSPGTLTVSGTGDIIELYISPESAVAQCDLKRGQGGIFYEISVGGFTPGIRQEAELLFSQMSGRDYLVVFQDGNGLYQVAGGVEEPLHFSFVARTGQVVSDRNGYEIQFTRNCTRPVYQVDKPF